MITQDQIVQTPRTDAANSAISEHQTYWDSKYSHLLNFAKTLERELLDAAEEAIRLRELVKVIREAWDNVTSRFAWIDGPAGRREAFKKMGDALALALASKEVAS